MQEIADGIGWSRETLYKLCEGNVADLGNIGALFREELLKIQSRNTERIKSLTKECKTLGLRKMDEFLRSIQRKKADIKLVKEVLAVMNTLSKSTPSVEIGAFS